MKATKKRIKAKLKDSLPARESKEYTDSLFLHQKKKNKESLPI